MPWPDLEYLKADREVRKMLQICRDCSRRARRGRLTCSVCGKKQAKRIKRWHEKEKANAIRNQNNPQQ
jgi:hypothetical protein